MEHLQGRTDIVHEQLKERFTDPSHADAPEWIEQRWPRESLLPLPMIDGDRVREIAFDLRKHTSCAADHVVIEMLRELDSDIRETIASCFQFRLLNHWTEDTDSVWKTQLVPMVKKKNGKLTMRGFRPIAMLPTIYQLYSKTLQQLAGGALQSRHGPQYRHVPGRQAHEVVVMLRRVVEQATEWQILVLVMDCDGCGV